jgi:hypothetical protein
MPASNQQPRDAIAGALQFCDSLAGASKVEQAPVTCLSREYRKERDGLVRQETQPMPATAFEIGGKAAQLPEAAHHAQFFGIVAPMQMPNSATTAALRAARAGSVHPAPRAATHTDPQILFVGATS